MAKPKKPRSLNSILIPGLRRLNLRWPYRNEAVRNARKERGRYECASCKNLFKNGEYIVDHKEPIVDPTVGFTTWDDYITKMFCPSDGFQVLCKACSSAKTMVENELRKEYRQRKKEIDNIES